MVSSTKAEWDFFQSRECLQQNYQKLEELLSSLKLHEPRNEDLFSCRCIQEINHEIEVDVSILLLIHDRVS
jgi:hypothetical protein